MFPPKDLTPAKEESESLHSAQQRFEKATWAFAWWLDPRSQHSLGKCRLRRRSPGTAHFRPHFSSRSVIGTWERTEPVCAAVAGQREVCYALEMASSQCGQGHGKAMENLNESRVAY